MNDVEIKNVNNNKEKYETYTTFMDKYNLAMKNEFYFETIFISYAMLEDRFKSFLFHIGAIKNMDSFTLDIDETKHLLGNIYFEYGFKDYKDRRSFDKIDLEKITGKRRMVVALFKWAKFTKYQKERTDYLNKLKELILLFDYTEYMDLFSSLNKWVNFRNKLIHDLMNKNCGSVNKLLKDKAEAGLSYARCIDKLVVKARKVQF